MDPHKPTPCKIYTSHNSYHISYHGSYVPFPNFCSLALTLSLDFRTQLNNYAAKNRLNVTYDKNCTGPQNSPTWTAKAYSMYLARVADLSSPILQKLQSTVSSTEQELAPLRALQWKQRLHKPLRLLAKVIDYT